MNRTITTFAAYMLLMLGSFPNALAQTVIGICSDTVYLLSVFHNSGEKDNKAENYYCAVFLDKESDIERLLPLKTEKSVYIHCDTSDLMVKNNWYVRTNAKTEKLINEEIENHFVANPCIGAGMAHVAAYCQYMKNRDTTDSYYHFLVDVLLKSEMSNYLLYPDMLSGEITESLVTGGLMIGWCDNDPPLGTWKFDYEKQGTYYKLFKLCADYLLLKDPDGSVLAKSYKWVIDFGMGDFDCARNVKFLLGNNGNPFITHLRVVLKEGEILTALPYSVVKLTEE